MLYGQSHGYPIRKIDHVMSGFTGDRDAKGKLLLRDLGLYRSYLTNTSYTSNGPGASSQTPSLTEIAFISSLPRSVRAAAQSETYARLRGKLYEGSAALGVTAGSYKQSREMIVNRYKTLNASADDLTKSLTRSMARKRVSKDLAGQHLEIIFGWQPLIQDIVATTLTVAQLAARTEFVSASVVKPVTLHETWNRDGYIITERTVCTYRCTRSATVVIANPNLWLMERAGLLNLASVAWDLVPWSFVVNMVVNTGQLVNSVTDFVGLEFPSGSTTETLNGVGETTCRGRGAAKATHTTRQKTRNLDPVAAPPLAFRLPNVDWGAAAMAASLFTQKFSKISSLVTNLRRHT